MKCKVLRRAVYTHTCKYKCKYMSMYLSTHVCVFCVCLSTFISESSCTSIAMFCTFIEMFVFV